MDIRISRVLPLMLCFTGCVVLAAARADDYPQWRGPQRSGISRETGLLKAWPKEGPKLQWQVKDVGYGFGAPAVAGDRIYLISNKGSDNEFVQALSGKDGQRLWSTKIGAVGSPNQMPSYPAARSTPTVDGELLYVLGSDGDLACLESATGKVRWQKNVRKEFGGQPGIWAYSESPLVDGDAVVCTPGGSQATLLALNKKTGGVIWQSALPGADQAAYASITVARLGGVRQYVQFLKNGVVGVDPQTGKFLWRFDKTADKRMGGNIGTPVSFNDYVYSASGMVAGGLAHIQAKNGSFEAEPVYVSRKLPMSIGGAVKVGDNLYGTSNNVLMCIDFATGVIKWEDRSIGPGALCYADGRLYLHGEAGGVALVEAVSEGYREKGQFTPPNPPERNRTQAWAYPVVANGRLYIRDLGSLWCYDVKDAKSAKQLHDKQSSHSK